MSLQGGGGGAAHRLRPLPGRQRVHVPVNGEGDIGQRIDACTASINAIVAAHRVVGHARDGLRRSTNKHTISSCPWLCLAHSLRWCSACERCTPLSSQVGTCSSTSRQVSACACAAQVACAARGAVARLGRRTAWMADASSAPTRMAVVPLSRIAVRAVTVCTTPATAMLSRPTVQYLRAGHRSSRPRCLPAPGADGACMAACHEPLAVPPHSSRPPCSSSQA